MEKDFNITGICRPSENYMADVSGKLTQVLQLVKKGKYFIINRPRQYGKTTTLYTIARMLRETGEYLVFNISFEGIGDDVFKEETKFAPGFVGLLETQAKAHAPEHVAFLKQKATEVHTMSDLAKAITDIALQTPKKVVVLIDEVDKSSNNQ